MNQCARTFVLVGLVAVFLLAMHLLPTVYMFGVEMQHVNILSDIIPEVYGSADTVALPVPKLSSAASHPQSDSAATPRERFVVPEGVTMIEDYSGGASGGMASFYGKLAGVRSLGRPVRIAYYGDSFIEGDILTCDLREMMQARFGGNGVGWVDCADKLNGFRRTVSQTSAGLAEHEVVKKPFSHLHEGINQRYFIPSQNAYVKTCGTKFRKLSSFWHRSSLFLRTGGGLTLHTAVNGGDEMASAIGASPSVQMVACADSAKTRCVSYRFADVGPDTYIYGMALESDRGVILDNFSMRGSAGYTIADIPQETLRDFARLRPYDLIVLHFGLNVVSDGNTSANYKAYVHRMKRTVAAVRRAYPDAAVLIVSVPDRAQRTADGVQTMKGVEALAAYQQVLASECGVAYFNLFKAMGGRGSMKDMVDKRWANKDYTHLSFAGGRHVAKYIYDSFVAGCEEHKMNAGD